MDIKWRVILKNQANNNTLIVDGDINFEDGKGSTDDFVKQINKNLTPALKKMVKNDKHPIFKKAPKAKSDGEVK